EDLRLQGSGWFGPRVPRVELPAPLNSVWPVNLVEVVPEPAGVPPAKDVAAEAGLPSTDAQARLTPAARALLADEAQATKPTRLQILLATNSAHDDLGWQQDLRRAAPGLVVEGRLGQIVTVLATPAQMPSAAELPMVSNVRLPRAALPEAV